MLKTFAFQFLNSFASLYYAAFAQRRWPRGIGCKPDANDDDDGACVSLLSSTLLTLYLAQILVTNLVENALPLAVQKYKRHVEGGIGQRFSRAELEYVATTASPLPSLPHFSSLIARLSSRTVTPPILFPLVLPEQSNCDATHSFPF